MISNILLDFSALFVPRLPAEKITSYLIVIPPQYGVSAVIGQMKQYTAGKLREKFSWLRKVYWKERVVWSLGFFVSTIGLNEKQIIAYVKWQAHQDSGQAKLELF